MPYVFNSNDRHTLGVELELQLVDRETGGLTNSIDLILDEVPEHWNAYFKPEFMQSYCEINTAVCNTVADVERDLSEKVQWAYDVAARHGLTFLWGGTHPFSRWEQQKISEGERYAWLLETMQDVARRLVVFGLHVHVGVDSGDKAIQMCDRLLRHLPTMLALSTSSPMWCGRNTGMFSYRSKIMEALPTAGLPHPLRNWSEYVWLIDHLIATDFIRSIREIWWDVRPHAGFGTVEIRIMDMPQNMRHMLGLVALAQSTVASISDNIDRGAYLYDSHPMIAKQNKWHAVRYGLDATFVDFDTMLAVPARQMAKRMIDSCAPMAERLGCLEQLNFLHEVIEQGTSAHQQRKIWKDTGDINAVVRYLHEQSQQAVSA